MESVLNLLEAAGGSMLRWVGWMNIVCGLLLVGALAADRLLARRVAPAWRMLLYAAVLVRVALPASTPSPIGLAPASVSEMSITLRDMPAGPGTASLSRHETPAATAPAIAGTRRSALLFVLPVYVLGASVLLAAWWVGARRLHAAAGRAADTGRRIGPRGRVPVLRHETLGPVLIGVLSPRLLIPAALTERDAAASLDWVLRHESAHLSRRDPLLAAALHTVAIATWPILAVWAAAARVRGLMEQACDDRVLRGARGEERAKYGQTLIDLASSRGLRWCSPALPFGTGVRARVRAIAAAARWPAQAQCVLIVLIAAMLVACSGAGADLKAESVVRTSLHNASAEPHKGSLPIRVTILRSWPAHARLDFAPGRAGERVLTRDEFAEVLAGATAADRDAVLSRPRMEVIPGLPATIRVDGERSGFELASTVTQVMIPAGQTARVYTMDLGFERTADERIVSAALARGVKVPQGHTVALLAAGREPLLVCVSPGPDEVQTRFGDTDEADETRPLINFLVRIHRVDAPRDQGSPKGDGPRRNWSAYPGGQLLPARVFAGYLEELRSRPGYAMLSAPQVWVYPDQEATIELTPEPDAAAARQTIRIRGTTDGDGVLCTGSYARSHGGMNTEGSWNQPVRIEAGGAMVWSLHDAERGAWYTVTIQASAHEAGSIQPQRATAPPR
ncbi:MAG: M56 family metallopeptidase [Phycisphaeraceae bacterium]|nr:M56 family metallopeptidase [Phycisphaeraceae bacterium]